MRSVAVTNAKGGVGKSTTAINMAAALAELDRRTLLIDADPSGNAALGYFARGTPSAGLADALLDGARLDEVAVASEFPGLDVVPPGDRLGACSDQMGSTQGLGQGREFRVRRLLKGLAGYDAVVVDTSPVLTPLNVAILYAVADILIPIDPCVAALAGVRALEDLVRTVSEFRLEFTDAGPLTIAGVLITRADRTLVSKQIEAEVRAYFGGLVYPRVVPASVKFREAYARGTPLIHYDRFNPGAAAYRAAAAAYLGGAGAGLASPAGAEGLDDREEDDGRLDYRDAS
ncbi:Soj-like protein (plasmid) [Aquisphaera giovannonii]|uniref:Soj-like protein n=1 Tax=Aquisphaera giovannonii TaxID=406548 RepID=A0A5B9WGZ1_9BACT|nr:ParA family protein [Aquisphaera giovannonii]QEH39211.1 Soj-like protein [Aquisphaera giovannonii]